MVQEIDLSKFPKWLPAFPVESPESGSLLHRLQQIHEGIRLVGDDFVEAQKRIHGDVKLSEAGKTDAIQREVKSLLDRLDKISSAMLARAKGRIEAFENELRDEGERQDYEHVVNAIRAQEIRGFYQSLDASGRLDAVKQALEDGDRELLAALLSAPKPIRDKLMPERIRETVEAEVLKARNPDKHREMVNLRDAVTVVTESRAIVESFIKSESGLKGSLEERIRAQAGGA